MRIGLLSPPHAEESGGGFTFVDMIDQAIRHYNVRAEIVILNFREIDYFPEDQIPADETVNGHLEPAINVRFTRSLNHHIRQQKIDLLWLVTPSTTVVPCIPFIVTVWDLAHRYQPFFPEVSLEGWIWSEREGYYRTVLPRASYIFVGTHRGAHEVRTCYNIPDERLRVVPLPAPLIAAKAPGSPRVVNRPYLFYPAQFWAHKNHVRAVKALGLLRNEFGMDLDLVFVGSDQGNKDFVRDIVDREGLAEHVHFLGFVARSMVETLYRDAEALLYLSFLGPDNLPPLEAFSCRCPVVVSDHPGHREQLSGGAMFVDPLDERSIALGVKRLMDDSSLRDALATQGEALVKERRIEVYLAAVRNVFDEFAAYQACWPANSSIAVDTSETGSAHE